MNASAGRSVVADLLRRTAWKMPSGTAITTDSTSVMPVR